MKYKEVKTNKKAVIVTSGGMDSIANGLMLLKKGYEIHYLHVNYGQKAEPAETNACKMVQNILRESYGQYVALHLYDFPITGTNSCLTNKGIKIPPGMESIKKSSTSIDELWVPARNVVFLSIGAALAEDIMAGVITLGCNQSESAYPDNTKEFLDRFTYMLKYGCIKIHPKVISPEWNMDKAEILRFTKKNYPGIAPFTWSCDDGGIMMDGTCGCCNNRLFADMVTERLWDMPYLRPLTKDPDYFHDKFIPDLKKTFKTKLGKRLWMYKYRDLI